VAPQCSYSTIPVFPRRKPPSFKKPKAPPAETGITKIRFGSTTERLRYRPLKAIHFRSLRKDNNWDREREAPV
ncbi:MAG: hypothetical protein VYB13_02135, partial [Chloroflexota bacterium]|nr:hypothetical protein [Chloroflexota bacterium]